MNYGLETWLRKKLREHHGETVKDVGPPRKVCHGCGKPRPIYGSKTINQKFYCETCASGVVRRDPAPVPHPPKRVNPDFFSDPNVLREFLSTGEVPATHPEPVHLETKPG